MTLFFRLSICFLTGFFVNCESENAGTSTGDTSPAWVGTSSEFDDQFQIETDAHNSTTLINGHTKSKFEGLLLTEDLDTSKEKRYKDGKLNGLTVFSSKDGSRVEAHYKQGVLHGKMIMYDNENKVRSVIKYENGAVVP
jgi:antitoxin component YwqK of YwqJK toxin-antitoxin module